MAKELEQKKEEKTPAMEIVQKALKSKDELIEKQGQVLNHPQVQELLKQLEQGKEVVIGEKPVEESKEKQLRDLLSKSPGDSVPEKDEDWDALSNKQMVDVLGDVVQTYVDGVKKSEADIYQNQIKEMKQELLTTQQSVLNLAAQNEVKAFQKNNPDFEQYREKMQEVVQRIPGINVQDAYDLVKVKHLASVPGPNETFSERPESSSDVPTWEPPQLRAVGTKTDESSQQPVRGASTSGSRNFQALARQALAKTQLQSTRRA